MSVSVLLADDHAMLRQGLKSLLEGILGIAVGLMAVFQPQWILYTALFIIAIWAIGSGIIRIFDGMQLRKEIAGEWMMIASGILSALAGLLILLLPDPALLTVLWIISIVLFMNSGVLIGFGIQLNGGTAKRWLLKTADKDSSLTGTCGSCAVWRGSLGLPLFLC